MIITKLQGGLGNQMFQYAIGRASAEKTGTALKLDIDGYNNQIGITQRVYSLSPFNIKECFATEEEINKLKNSINVWFFKISQKIGLFRKYNSFVCESHFNFYPEISDLNGDLYLQGYWQTEKYFQNIEDIICKEFTLKKEFSIEDKGITKEIKNSNAISLHIRRGDYVSSAIANESLGTCSLEYYMDAIKYITEKVKDATFYIFSDDIQWVKENLKIGSPAKYVSDGILEDYEELVLMSYCKHNIIANSSFSWWGAWLNNNKNKIIIAPRKWFNTQSFNNDSLIPSRWIKI